MISEVLVRGDNDILLVKQQKVGDSKPYWTLPGGLVEPDELVAEAVARETLEETGITIHSIDLLTYISQCHSLDQGEQTMVFCLETSGWSGEITCEDPDQVVAEARFLSAPAAIGKLDSSPRRGRRGLRMTEPLVAYLDGSVENGALWFYREWSDGDYELTGRLPAER